MTKLALSPQGIDATLTDYLSGLPWTSIAVVAVAILLAYLTSADLWRIRADRSDANASRGLDSNFSKTVIGGLLGVLALGSFTDLFETLPTPVDPRLLYITVFVVAFGLFQLAWALLSGLTEALRIAAVLRYSDTPTAKAAAVVFFDTFLSILKGKHEFRSEVFDRELRTVQASIGRAINEVRKQLDRATTRALRESFPNEVLEERDVRVNMAVLSENGRELHYVARSAGSVPKAFPRKSVAWVAATSQKGKWWKLAYHNKAWEVPRLCTEGATSKVGKEFDGLEVGIGNKTVAVTGGNDLDELASDIRRAYSALGHPVTVEVGTAGTLTIVSSSRHADAFPAPSLEGLDGLQVIPYADPATIRLEPASADEELRKATLDSHFQVRQQSDYAAFVVLPVPFTGRGAGMRQGVLLISFKKATFMDALWPALDMTTEEGERAPDYNMWVDLLNPADDDLRHILKSSKEVLARLFEAAHPSLTLGEVGGERE